jgi:putative nucleotidyltransferase with HDIG domain
MERLPSVPALYTQVTAELARPEGSIQFVGRLISKDPALTARILQMINSGYLGLSVRISDPMEAVLHLGVEQTKSMILLADAFLHFEQSACPGFSHDHLWRHSLAVGSSALAITRAETKNLELAELAYTAGLLHDIGMLLLAANLPEIYSDVIEQAQRRDLQLHEIELEVFETTHAELGAAVMKAWGLPDAVLQAISLHHCPDQSEDTEFSLLTAVHAANAIEREKLLHGSHRLVNQFNTSYIEKMGLGDRQSAWRQLCGLLVAVVPDKEMVDPFRVALGDDFVVKEY